MVEKFYEEPSRNKDEWHLEIRKKFLNSKPEFFPYLKPAFKRMLEYGKGDIPGTIPSGIKKTLTEDLPEVMYRPPSEEHGQTYLDLAMMGLGAGMPGGASGKATVGSIRKIKRAGKTTEYASSVNLEKQKIPESLKDIERIMAQRIHERHQSWDTTGKLSKELYKDFDRMKKVINKQGPKSAVEIDAIRQLNVDALAYLKHLSTSNIPRAQFDRAFNIYKDKIFRSTTKAAEETGRALNIFKKSVSLNRVAKAFTKLERGLNERELAEFKQLDFEDATAVKFFIDRLGNPKFKDYVVEFWYNQILSGIPTHIVNVANNTLWYLYQVPHRAHKGVWDKVIKSFSGKPRERFVSEAIPIMGGFKSTGKGLKGARDILKSGQVTSFESKWAKEQGYALGAFDRSPYKTVRGIGKFVTIPTKALRAMDVLGNTIAFDGQMKALALRDALKKGLKGTAQKEHIETFLKNPPDWAFDNAMKFAKYSTFMDDPGAISTAIIHLRDAIPGGVGRFIVPFVNTIGNLMKRGIEMTPGIGIPLLKGQSKAEIVAKQIEGAILSTYTLKKFLKGEIIGPAPEKKAERDAMYRRGEKPWSIKIGDSWYQYRRMEPFSTVMGATAIVAEKLKKGASDKEISEAMVNSIAAYKDFLIDSSYLSGISQVFDKYGSRKNILKNTASGFVPYSSFWRSIQRAYEAETQGDAKLRKANDWIDVFRINLPPGLLDPSEPTLDVWGKEIVLEGGAFRQWLPFKWSESKDDALENSLKKLNIYPAPPSQTIKYKGEYIKLDDDIYRQFAIGAGNDLKKSFENFLLKDTLQRAIEDERKHNRIVNILQSKRQKIYDKWRKRAIKEQLRQ